MEFYEFAEKRLSECNIPFGKAFNELHFAVYKALIHKLHNVKNRLNRLISQFFDKENFNLNSTIPASEYEAIIFSEFFGSLEVLTTYEEINKIVSFYPIEVFKGINYKIKKLYLLEVCDISTQLLAEKLIETAINEEPSPSAKTKRIIIEKMFKDYYTLSTNIMILTLK